MEQASRILNTFVGNTCVIVVFAYLLTRFRLTALLFQGHSGRREAVLLAGVFGLMGLAELFFASARFPYDTYTLIVTFAAVNAGARVGGMTAGLIALGSLFFIPEALARTGLSLLADVGIALGIRRLFCGRHRLTASLVAVVLAEAGAIVIRLRLPGPTQAPFSGPVALERLAANAFGIVLLQLIVNDAQVRALAEVYRSEVERTRTLQAESQLADLRARMHPHFLFNTLTSIAGLCAVSPDKAEETIVHLGQIMRRAMTASDRAVVPLREELEYVRDYLEIERLRFGERVSLVCNFDEACGEALVPPFSVQTLMENAVNHGVSPKPEQGTITLTARRGRGRVLIAVQDDGVGMTVADRSRALVPYPTDRLHGMQILTQQLTLLYGRGARLRLFSAPERGTCAVFSVPFSDTLPVLHGGHDTPGRFSL